MAAFAELVGDELAYEAWDWFGSGVSSAASAGAALGTIGSAVSIYNGLYAADSLPERKRMPRANVVNSQAHRAAMKVTGSKNVRSVRGKQRHVKVSHKLREKIKKVIESKNLYGTYVTTRHNMIGVVHAAGNGNTYKNAVVGAYAVPSLVSETGLLSQLSNCRWWFNAGVSGQSGTNDQVIIGDDFNLFTPMKIMDAASILWNNKTIRRDYSDSAGNFVMVTDLGTGAPATITRALPNSQGTRVHIVDSYVKFEIRNCSQRAMRVWAYHFVPKTQHPDALPIDTMLLSIRQFEQDNTNNKTIRTFPFAGTTQEDALMNDPQFPLRLLDGFNTTYKWERKDMLIAPGETCLHYVRGPKNYDLDFSKLYEGGNDKTAFLSKMSVAVTFCTQPDILYTPTGSNATTAAGVGRWIPGTPLIANKIGDPIAIEMVETFKLTMPENSGFFQQAVTAGAAKVLSLRRKQYAFANFTNQELEVDIAYTREDEENAGTIISSSVIN